MPKRKSMLLCPDDLSEYSPKPLAFSRMNALYEPDAAFQVFTEARMVFPVLSRGSETDTVGERSLQPIGIRAHDIQALVRYQTGQALADACSHDARLAVMHGESFLRQNCATWTEKRSMRRSNSPLPENARSSA
jgi:hypothetical protein